MLFLFSVIDHRTGSATDAEMSDIDAFNAKLREGGHWIFAGGLAEPSSASIVDARTGEASVTAGPLIEATEYPSGLWIVEAADQDEAMRLAAEGSRACGRRIEVRAVL